MADDVREGNWHAAHANDLGDPDRFPAGDLERWFLAGTVDGSAKVQGRVLNAILRTSRFPPLAWYLLTEHGLEPWADA
jgi:hypothetical protein